MLGIRQAATNPLEDGHYYRRQLRSRNKVIAWSRRSRFDLALQLLSGRPGRVLDYGCGDGTFLALAANRITSGLGVDLAPDQVEDCRRRFNTVANLSFAIVGELADLRHAGHYDVVVCMETLEHCTDPMVEQILSDLARLVTRRQNHHQRPH